METETHRGYYTTDPETTSEGKKRCVVYFWDSDFADKVELDLSGGRELIQEDGKWFVVKKKKEYPKTYEECARVLGFKPYHLICNKQKDAGDYVENLSVKLECYRKLIVCRDAYWLTAGREMGLEKPWEPDYTKDRYIICRFKDKILRGHRISGVIEHFILEFPTEEMRDAFFNAFRDDIEKCKELL